MVARQRRKTRPLIDCAKIVSFILVNLKFQALKTLKNIIKLKLSTRMPNEFYLALYRN
jgi:hypothetical protein